MLHNTGNGEVRDHLAWDIAKTELHYMKYTDSFTRLFYFVLLNTDFKLLVWCLSLIMNANRAWVCRSLLKIQKLGVIDLQCLLQLWSVTKRLFICISITHNNNISYQKCQGPKHIKICFNNWHGSHPNLNHRLQILWNMFMKSVFRKSYHSDIKIIHDTKENEFSVVNFKKFGVPFLWEMMCTLVLVLSGR